MPIRMAASQTPRNFLHEAIRWLIGRGGTSRGSSGAGSWPDGGDELGDRLRGITNPAGTIGKYIHAIEIGMLTASMSWFVATK